MNGDLLIQASSADMNICGQKIHFSLRNGCNREGLWRSRICVFSYFHSHPWNPGLSLFNRISPNVGVLWPYSISSKGSFDDWIPCSWRSHINELHKSIAHPFPLVAVLVDLMWTLSLPDPCFYGPNHFPRELWFIKLISGKEIRSTASAEGTLGQVLDSYSCS